MGDQNARTAGRTSSLGPPDQRNDRWLTPMPIIDAITVDIGLPPFDLDPCGAPDHFTAARRYILEDGDDGLRDPWYGRVWMNPPYGRMKNRWLHRFVSQYKLGNITGGTILIPYNPDEVEAFHELMYPMCDALMAYRHRINFVSRDDKTGKGMVSVNASALIAFGQQDADALWEAVTKDLIPGFLTDYTGVAR
jgi:hypothetical protein